MRLEKQGYSGGIQAARRGFSLVELSIVIAIIGLLVGAILGGQALVARTKVNKTIAEIEMFKSAFLEFETKYKSMPGDLPTAARFFDAGVNGNGDGQISPYWTEGLQAWYQLGQARLIPAGDYGTKPYDFGIGIRPGTDVPVTAYDPAGGYSFTYENGGGANNNFSMLGNVIHIGRAYTGATTKGPLFPGNVAYVIDQKLDDGIPSSGAMHAWDTVWNPNCTKGSLPNVTYSRDNSGIDCALLLKF